MSDFGGAIATILWFYAIVIALCGFAAGLILAWVL